MPRGRAVSRDPGYSLDSTLLGGIPKRSVPETVEVARLAGRVEFERPAPGRSGAGEGGTRGATWKAPIPELRMSLRPTLHPRPHLPPPLRNKWIRWLVNAPLEVAFSKT